MQLIWKMPTVTTHLLPNDKPWRVGKRGGAEEQRAAMEMESPGGCKLSNDPKRGHESLALAGSCLDKASHTLFGYKRLIGLSCSAG